MTKIIAFFQRETLHIGDSLPDKNICLNLIRRVAVTASIFIPLIGMFSRCIKEPLIVANRGFGLTEQQNLEPETRELDWSKNELTQVSNLNELTHLTHLNLSQNKLTKPPHIGKNAILQHLNRSKNSLDVAPIVKNNKHLAELDLSHNQLTVPPRSELQQGAFSARSFCQSACSSPRRWKQF